MFRVLFWGKIFTYPNTDGLGAGIADEDYQPRMCISINQIESPQGGLISVLKWKQTSRKYHAATIFVDHFSKFTYVKFSQSTAANEAVEAKHAFEQYAATFGVNIQKYYAENGAFDTRVFKENIIPPNQTIDFSGVDVHHQNVIAERMVKTVTYCSRSILLNVMTWRTDVITTELWPYAIKLAIDTGNNCPDESGLTVLYHFSSKNDMLEWNNFIPLDRFASSLIPNYVKINRFHNGYLCQDKPFILVYSRRM